MCRKMCHELFQVLYIGCADIEKMVQRKLYSLPAGRTQGNLQENTPQSIVCVVEKLFDGKILNNHGLGWKLLFTNCIVSGTWSLRTLLWHKCHNNVHGLHVPDTMQFVNSNFRPRLYIKPHSYCRWISIPLIQLAMSILIYSIWIA